jgi:hypothetical protein
MSNERARYQAATEILETLYQEAVSEHLAATDFEVLRYLKGEKRAQWLAAEQVELEYVFGTPETEAEPRSAAATIKNAPRARAAPDIGKVVIEVYGGVAAITSKPENIEVEIIDHDNETNA